MKKQTKLSIALVTYQLSSSKCFDMQNNNTFSIIDAKKINKPYWEYPLKVQKKAAIIHGIAQSGLVHHAALRLQPFS